MKKYSFRLENVRRVRRLQEEAAKATLAAANRNLQLADIAVDDALVHYTATAAGVSGVGGVESFMQRRNLAELAGNAVVTARHHRQVAETHRIAMHQEWAATAQRLKALDRLDERAREEYRIEFDRDVDQQMDEINVGRAGRQATA